jgi:uncharacterized protein (TIGR00730 family)
MLSQASLVSGIDWVQAEWVRICVFCGSSNEVDPRLLVAARVVGQLIAKRGFGLVYGGASIGMMGAIADAALEGGAEVIGVMPKMLVDREVAHTRLTRLEVVQTLHQRKARMDELSNAIAVLPGGYGTLDEAFEVLTWRSLGLHDKPIAFLDALGFWKPLRALTDHLHAQRFVRTPLQQWINLCPTPESLLDALDPNTESSLTQTSPGFGPPLDKT